MKVYLDTSVVLSYYLESSVFLDQVPDVAEVGSSRLLWIEFSRVLDRAIRLGQLSPEDAIGIRRAFDEMSRTIDCIRIGEAVLKRAEGSFPLLIRSLDAIHLASAEVWCAGGQPSELSIWTLDRQFNLCAAAMGFSTPLFELT